MYLSHLVKGHRDPQMKIRLLKSRIFSGANDGTVNLAGSTLDWGVCDLLRFCQRFTSRFPYLSLSIFFPSASDLTLKGEVFLKADIEP